MTSILDSVLDGVSKSKQLLELAESGEWEQFLELEEQRRASLSVLSLDNLDLDDEQYAKIREPMVELVALNEQLESVCIQQRSELAKELQKIQQGNKVNKAYTQ